MSDLTGGYESSDMAVLEHYSRFQGTANKLWTFDSISQAAPGPIHIAEFAPSSKEYDWVYATVGLSRKAMPGAPNPDHRIELMMYARERREELADVLAKLSIYPFVHDTYFASGHTIAGQPGVGVVDGSDLTEFLLTPVYFETDGFDMFELPGGIHVQVLWATPIARSERMFVLQHGWKALVEGPFVENEVQPADLYRPPVV